MELGGLNTCRGSSEVRGAGRQYSTVVDWQHLSINTIPPAHSPLPQAVYYKWSLNTRHIVHKMQLSPDKTTFCSATLCLCDHFNHNDNDHKIMIVMECRLFDYWWVSKPHFEAPVQVTHYLCRSLIINIEPLNKCTTFSIVKIIYIWS